MSKRTRGLVRRKHDAYDTPAHAVTELLKHLLPGTRFIEPCWGKGELAAHLMDAGHACVFGIDIEPRAGRRIPADGVRTDDARTFIYSHRPGFKGASCFITNPPWTRELLHPIIENLAGQLPTWLLFDGDWPHNVNTPKHLLDICERIVPQGRVKWMEGHPDDKGHAGKDNACWYRFDATHSGGPRWFNRRGR